MRRVGLPAPSTVRAADQLQKSFPPGITQPLPPGTPGRATGEQVGIKDPGATLSFLVIGDHGGIENPVPQDHVAAALALEVAAGGISFVNSVGDWCYYDSDPDQWMPQFYSPYTHVPVPFVGIAGNHDGDPNPVVSGSGIPSWMANLCTPSPAAPPGDPELEFGRHTQTQPYCDWTLQLEAVTIVGVWSNVPSGGRLAASQVAWLTQEVAAAPRDRPLIVQLHHPPLSVDAHHGGSKGMGDALAGAFQQAVRWPALILSGHVHDAQFFTEEVGDGTKVKYVVIGNSGYRNLHALAGDATPGMEVVPGVTFDYGDASGWGYLRLTVTGGKIVGDYVQVAHDGTVRLGAYTFTA
jgi:hypothetical protein